jgi:hypothetical protein
MTALQQIIKEAKILRKKNPKMEWKKAVAQASAIYASKHKGKSPVGKKHKKVVRKKAAKKVSGIKKTATKRKPTEKAVLKSIKKAVSVQKAHMSGLDHKKNFINDYRDNQIKIAKIEKSILGYQNMLKNPKTEKHLKAGFKTILNTLKLHLKEYKIHGKELKKHI